jgi:hypothetical protein
MQVDHRPRTNNEKGGPFVSDGKNKSRKLQTNFGSSISIIHHSSFIIHHFSFMSPIHPLEGSLKFTCYRSPRAISIPAELFESLNRWRRVMWEKALIGIYPDGIGYGNISMRIPGSDQFVISGTATGGLRDLEINQYAMVERCDPDSNTVWCKGELNASAESMSHYAIYTALPEVQAVVHIHNRPLWDKYLNLLPTTSPEIEYGTPAMAGEITRILYLPETHSKKVIIMGGHEEGIISFGQTLEEAARIILEL